MTSESLMNPNALPPTSLSSHSRCTLCVAVRLFFFSAPLSQMMSEHESVKMIMDIATLTVLSPFPSSSPVRLETNKTKSNLDKSGSIA